MSFSGGGIGIFTCFVFAFVVFQGRSYGFGDRPNVIGQSIPSERRV